MSNLFFIVVVACAATALIQQYFKHSRRSQRRIYWCCACVGAVAACLAFYPDWKKGLGMALFFLGVMTVAAYAYTPYIKIGGKICALTVQDSRPDTDDRSVKTHARPAAGSEQDPAPDAYSGIISAAKMWWLLIPLLVISSGNLFAFATGKGEAWVALIGIAFLVFLAVATGYGDASWGYGIARGQHVQFGLAAIVTVGVFAVLYLVAYHVGKRWPLRRKQSMEYRAHPRHGKLD
jgi:hypothetical protein